MNFSKGLFIVSSSVSLSIICGIVLGVNDNSVEAQSTTESTAVSYKSSSDRELYKNISTKIKLPTEVILSRDKNYKSIKENYYEDYKDIFLDEKPVTGTMIYTHLYENDDQTKKLYYYAIDTMTHVDDSGVILKEEFLLINGIEAVFMDYGNLQLLSFYDSYSNLFYALVGESTIDKFSDIELLEIANSMYK